jgi:hypothetical protein
VIGWVPYVMSAFFHHVGGEETCRAILAEAGFDAAIRFRLDASYADAACRRLLDAACARLGVTEAQAFALFAPFFLEHARQAFPAFFSSARTVRDFLLHQPEVHNTLSAGLPDRERGEVAAKFRIETLPGGELRVFYRSPNRLAGLYAAIALRLGEELNQPVGIVFEAGGPADRECVMRIATAATALAA